ncbi:MAG: peptide chain release factor N(5)-glutamine methyltransferase [Pseudomonadota bacterium]
MSQPNPPKSMRGAGSKPVGALLAEIAATLARAGVDTARLDARLLVQAASALSHEEIVADPNRELSASIVDVATGLAARRAGREPMAYILGCKEFWSQTFRVTEDVLIPRADSEVVVEAALAAISGVSAPRIADLGVGSGCLLLTLLAERPDAIGLGVDISAGAAGVALCNAQKLGLDDRAAIVVGDWHAALASGFDLILSNPPYVGEMERTSLSPDVRDHEPDEALFAKGNGLASYERIFNGVWRLLRPRGVLALEIGSAQGEAVSQLLERSNADAASRIVYDLADRPRGVVAIAP